VEPEDQSIDGETRGQWYLRQMLGSANISGGSLSHLMSGNLSLQIEHHLFPDLASNRYCEIAPKVAEQVASAWHNVIRLSLPNDLLSSGVHGAQAVAAVA
jgi:linoleoyl-CoA desaturase